jgi:mRNA interferase MazF
LALAGGGYGMAKFMKGDVVVIPFPFSDLSQSKRRPALVVASFGGNDAILCQITSKTVRDAYGISLDDKDFISGSLKQSGNIRPNRLFTADSNIILYRIGNIKKEKLLQVVDKIIEILRYDPE